MWGRSDVGQLGLSKLVVEKDDNGYLMKYPKNLISFQNQ